MNSKIIRNESEVDCYGFTLEKFKLEGRIFAKITLKNCVDNFKSKLIEKLKDANASHETIKKLNDYPNDDLCLKIFNSFEPIFEEFDKFVDETLSLSDNMIYRFDKCTNYNEADEKYLLNEIQEHETWYMQNKYMLFAMQSELEMYKEIEPMIQKEAHLAKTLEKSFKSFQNDYQPNENLMETIRNIENTIKKNSLDKTNNQQDF